MHKHFVVFSCHFTQISPQPQPQPHIIALLPVKQTWRIWVNETHESIGNPQQTEHIKICVVYSKGHLTHMF